jgi:hypothetical protein
MKKKTEQTDGEYLGLVFKHPIYTLKDIAVTIVTFITSINLLYLTFISVAV